MNRSSFVSVIQPVFNAELFLNKTIESILTQTYKDFEYILVDDGSTDNSNEILRRYSNQDKRIKVYTLVTNMGYNYALNYAVSVSCGEYLFRIDSDDIIENDVLENRLKILKSDSSIALVSGSSKLFITNFIEKSVTRILPSSPSTISWLLCFGNPITHSSALFKKEIFNKCGGYDMLRNVEDWILWNKFAKYGHIKIEQKGDVYYRYHKNQSTSLNKNDPQFKSKITSVIKANLLNLFGDNILTNEDIDVLWGLYYDSSTRDLSFETAIKCLKFLNQLKKSYKQKLCSNKNLNNDFYFFYFLQKVRIISRVKNKIKRFSYIIIFVILYFPQQLILNYSLVLSYIKYLYKIIGLGIMFAKNNKRFGCD